MADKKKKGKKKKDIRRERFEWQEGDLRVIEKDNA